MSKVRIPNFLLGTPRDELQDTLEKYKHWKQKEICHKLVDYLEDKLEKMLLEEETTNPLNWFQYKWIRAKNLGKREMLRLIIKDLK